MSGTGAALPSPVHPSYDGPEDEYKGVCPVCGTVGRYRRDRLSISESYRCESCVGALRYQSQARAVLRAFSRHGSRSVAEVVAEPEFRELRIFEPGSKGPFRKLFRGLDGYVQSFYEPTVPSGEVRDGMRCEDLMALTFAPETFDLVLTSDIFEHVRDPRRAFAEVFRVLRPGGWHLFTIPGRWPLPARTVARVDVSGAEDALVLPAVYHNHEYLVYNDFGFDLLDVLDDIGFVTEPMLFASASATTAAQVTFCSLRPAPVPDPTTSRSDRLRARVRSMRARLPLR